MGRKGDLNHAGLFRARKKTLRTSPKSMMDEGILVQNLPLPLAEGRIGDRWQFPGPGLGVPADLVDAGGAPWLAQLAAETAVSASSRRGEKEPRRGSPLLPGR